MVAQLTASTEPVLASQDDSQSNVGMDLNNSDYISSGALPANQNFNDFNNLIGIGYEALPS